jgi:hypothetical protein
MRAVAEESGVALGTIYRYYSGKDEMLIAASPAGCDAPVAGSSPVRSPATRRATDSSSCSSVRLRLPQNRPTLMGALIRALGTTSPAAIEHKLEVDTQFERWSSRRSVLIGDSMPRVSPA